MPDAAPLRILSTLAVMGVLQELLPAREAATGGRIEAVYAPTAKLLERIEAGAPADVAILTAEAVEALLAAGRLQPGSRVDLAISVVGIAVRAGAPRPDIATPEALRAALLAARSIAYSRAGASGIFFAGLVERLGIAAEVEAKATVIPQGFTAELAASGAAELAIQQVSELMTVPGVDIVGPLPAATNVRAVFSGGLLAGAPAAAGALLAHLAAASTPGLLAAKGLLPA
ncbi:substrate-binding domain-containing protein [Paeniroseomonas aquatica]|uniref:Substrate-binding domain-containing protein n=1 Tax=Paeniroseomonas aquatica TaxID=373043 RepID=A0ABT8AD06_9PROT|nr:substrate-binding domain-containing protein [Paeniroseomonas aquatica]MDN3567446.1 substrate-binding domain-containing protein [Paeniroseomonas aquatica]